MKRALGTILIATATVAGPALSRVHALEPGQKLEVELVGITTDHFKGRYGPTSQSSSIGDGLAEGEMGRGYLAYGTINEKAGASLNNLCTRASGDLKESDDPASARNETFASQRPAHYWYAEYRVLPSDIGKVTVQVNWEHWSAVGTGTPVKVAGDTRRIEMKEGEHHVLDYVSFAPPPDDYCASNVQIAITANVMEDPSFQYESLSYDVWFEHADAAGRVTRRHFDGVGRQGTEVSSQVEPMRFPVPDARTVDGVPYEAILELSAAIRGRVQADGSIKVKLGAGRWTGVEEAGKPRRGGIGDGGNKVFEVHSGETVRMTLPVPTGSHGIDETVAVNGVVKGRNKVNVDNKTFYAGSQDSIILTVNRVH